MPMVAEGSGAWDPRASAVLKRISRAAAAREGRDPDEEWTGLLQRTSVLLRRSRARAALRRRMEAAQLTQLDDTYAAARLLADADDA